MRCVHREFSYKSHGEKILKIGPHLPKLFIKHLVAYVFGTQCRIVNMVGQQSCCAIVPCAFSIFTFYSYFMANKYDDDDDNNNNNNNNND